MDSHRTIKVKPLGIIKRFNGIDVHQTNSYIKTNNTTYVKEIIAGKKCRDKPSHHLIIPMIEDPAYNKEIEDATPLDKKTLQHIKIEFRFSYRQGVGELIYAMATCRPNISFSLIKLSQYSAASARVHFKALHGI